MQPVPSAGKRVTCTKGGKTCTWCQARENIQLVPSAGKHAIGAERGRYVTGAKGAIKNVHSDWSAKRADCTVLLTFSFKRTLIIFVCFFHLFLIQEVRILVGKAFQKTDAILEENLNKLKDVSWLCIIFHIHLIHFVNCILLSTGSNTETYEKKIHNL